MEAVYGVGVWLLRYLYCVEHLVYDGILVQDSSLRRFRLEDDPEYYRNAMIAKSEIHGRKSAEVKSLFPEENHVNSTQKAVDTRGSV